MKDLEVYTKRPEQMPQVTREIEDSMTANNPEPPLYAETARADIVRPVKIREALGKVIDSIYRGHSSEASQFLDDEESDLFVPNVYAGRKSR